MTSAPLQSIRHTLGTRIGLIIFAIGLVVGTLFFLFSVRLSNIEFQNRIDTQTKHLSDTFAQLLWLFDHNATHQLAKLAIDSPGVIALKLMDHNGNIVLEKADPDQKASKVTIKRDLLYEKKTLVGYIEISFVNQFQKTQRNLIIIAIVSMMALIILSSMFLISVLLGRYLSLPLETLGKEMMMLTSGKFQASTIKGQKKEIQDIINAFNRMAHALAEREISQKKAEDAFKESEEKYRLAMEATTDGVWDWNIETGEVYFSKSWATILSEDSVLPELQTWESKIHPDDKIDVLSSLQYHLDGKVSLWQKEHRLRTKHGEWRWVLGRGRVVDKDTAGLPVRMVGTMTDISERKQIENTLQHAQRMESVGTLAGGIAHEFNNILSIIIGNNELIMEDLPAWHISRNNCEEIRLAGFRARDVVKQLLTFSRQDDSTKKPIEINSVVKECLKLIRTTTPTNIEIRDDISPDCFPVIGDSTQINQILINLCNNAIDALPISGGRIDIKLSNLERVEEAVLQSSTLKPGRYVKLLVRDNGKGIDKEIVDRIFEPYFTTKDIGEGSGIGLAVVHGIVANHGGLISCESAAGEGTIFTILIPAHEGSLKEDSVQSNTFPGKGECVLYVDDEPSIAELGRRHLEALGYRAFSTSDPVEALDLIRAEPDRFDIIISDMAMPKIPGDQLISEILSINPGMPAIICTGYSSRMSDVKALEMGVKAFVMKPLSKSELAKTVRQVLDNNNTV